MSQILGKRTTPKKYQNLEFQTLKDTPSTATTLLYRNTPWGPVSELLRHRKIDTV